MDMQGSKIAITLPTGQTVEFELMRVGTVKEYRRLLAESKTHKAKAEEHAKEITAVVARANTAEARSSKAEEELANLKSDIAQRKSRAAELFAKLDGGKSVLSQTLEEMMGVIGEIHEG